MERRLLDETAHRQRLVEEEVKMREKQCSQVSTSGECLNELASDQQLSNRVSQSFGLDIKILAFLS